MLLNTHILTATFLLLFSYTVYAEGTKPMVQLPAQTVVSTAPAKINLNAATRDELLKIPGINASKARAIVLYRKKVGTFKTVEELAKVSGFKRMKADKLKAIAAQLTL